MVEVSQKSGFILIDKGSGPTSHDVVAALRRITGIKKIGHAGTLDPLASGLLICAIGRSATKQISSVMKQDKVYEVEMILGAVSDTYDSQGKIESRSERIVEREELLAILEKFKGKQEQVPPMYSAKKVAGKKLYELARQGVEIERKPCSIEIKTLELIDYQWPTLKLVVECSTGTYIRSLVHDIGQSLGVGAYMSALRRTSIGDFKIEQALRLEELAKDNWEGFLI